MKITNFWGLCFSPVIVEIPILKSTPYFEVQGTYGLGLSVYG